MSLSKKSYRIDESHIVYDGDNYEAIEYTKKGNLVQCNECHLRNECGRGEVTTDIIFSCDRINRIDKKSVYWVNRGEVIKEKKIKVKKVIDNRTEDAKMICDLLLG